jgi:hypothetical protein
MEPDVLTEQKTERENGGKNLEASSSSSRFLQSSKQAAPQSLQMREQTVGLNWFFPNQWWFFHSLSIVE